MKLKRSFCAALFACGIFLVTSPEAEATPCKEQQKMYVAAEQINIDKDCILISLPQDVFGTMRLGKDEKGYYVYANELYIPKVHVYRCHYSKCNFATISEKVYNYHIAGHRSGKYGEEWSKRERGW